MSFVKKIPEPAFAFKKQWIWITCHVIFIGRNWELSHPQILSRPAKEYRKKKTVIFVFNKNSVQDVHRKALNMKDIFLVWVIGFE